MSSGSAAVQPKFMFTKYKREREAKMSERNLVLEENSYLLTKKSVKYEG